MAIVQKSLEKQRSKLYPGFRLREEESHRSPLVMREKCRKRMLVCMLGEYAGGGYVCWVCEGMAGYTTVYQGWDRKLFLFVCSRQSRSFHSVPPHLVHYNIQNSPTLAPFCSSSISPFVSSPSSKLYFRFLGREEV